MEEPKKPQYYDPLLLSQITDRIFQSADRAIETSFDPSYWVLTELKTSLFENQIEILEAVIDLKIRYLSIIGARSSGKTFGVSAGITKLCIDNPGLQVGVYAPKAGQAGRIIEEIFERLLNDNTRAKYLDMDRTTKSCLRFKNGATVLAQSAQVETLGEGWHFDIVVIDESQRVPELSFSQRIVPALKGRIAKIIQLGVPLYKGHFWESFNNPLYTKIKHDWLSSPMLFESGVLEVDGARYPRRVIDQMPKEIKQRLFPNHPPLHFESVTKMSVEDFQTQYAMEWLDNISLLLNEGDQNKLNGGTHYFLPVENGGEVYFFGLDFAGGEKVGDKITTDFTALTILRKNLDNTKDIVFAREWKGDFTTQLDELISLIHPQHGIFKCRGGLADYGNQGAPLVDIMKKTHKIPIEGVFFQSREPVTGKNYKNAMYEYFLFELRSDRIKYPNLLNSTTNHDVFTTLKRHFDEWCALERHRGIQVNDKIFGGDGENDDGPSSAIMALWAADKMGEGGIGWYGYRVPEGRKAHSLFTTNRMFQQSQNPNPFGQKGKRYT